MCRTSSPQTMDKQTVLSTRPGTTAVKYSVEPLIEVIDQVAEWRDHGLRYVVLINGRFGAPACARQ